MQGEVYVTVEADASTPNLMAAGSKVVETNKWKVRWKKPKGITEYSWPSGVNKTMTKQVINNKIQRAFNQNQVTSNEIDLWELLGCIQKI